MSFSLLEKFDNMVARPLEIELAQLRHHHEEALKATDDLAMPKVLTKRSDFPVMHIKRGKKKRTCQNMNGVLGGSNAFNFLSFVAGVITLVVNVNNNVNNNNNNLNGINANVNNQQNNNANANNNAANIILVMPGKKKRSATSSVNCTTALPREIMSMIQVYHKMNSSPKESPHKSI